MRSRPRVSSGDSARLSASPTARTVRAAQAQLWTAGSRAPRERRRTRAAAGDPQRRRVVGPGDTPGVLVGAHYRAWCTTADTVTGRRRGGGAVDASQLLKGVLDVAVLAVVRQADGYGYDVVRRLRAAGLEEVGDASVYGTLRRLYQAGALTSYVVPSDEGPHRKYYAINDRGRSVLQDSGKTWRTFVDSVDGLLAGASA
nr:PadR family transcriptional regulator [Modestobacter versicolor]